MSDKLIPTPPGGLPTTGPQVSNLSPGPFARSDPRAAAKIKLGSQTSVTVDATISLESASAQLLTLRNQATAAAASGDLASLQQLAVHAVAIGVAAGQKAESLAGAIAARFTAAGAAMPAGKPAPGDDTANLTALGLKPEEIARLFTDPADDGASAPASGIAGGLQALTALNTRAGAVITDARNLIASLNNGLKSGQITAGSGADEDLALHSLTQLLDQTESALNARIYAAGQQLGGAPAEPGKSQSSAGQTAPGLDLKT